MENSYIYSTENGNFIIDNLEGKYYYIISGENALKFDVEYKGTTVPSYDLPLFGRSYSTIEY